MKDATKTATALSKLDKRTTADEITESLLEMPEHYRAPLMVFLGKALDGYVDANNLRRDHIAGKLTKGELWEEIHRRYGAKIRTS